MAPPNLRSEVEVQQCVQESSGALNKNQNQNNSSSSSNTGFDTCGYGIEIRPFAGDCDGNNISLLEELGIQRSCVPAHPSLSVYESRLKTFASWPKKEIISPDKLSDAGFYYTGTEDQTICFHCGGGLMDWEQSDDPWVEHALWFGMCNFLNLRKGQEFILKVKTEKSSKVTVGEAKEILSQIKKTNISNNEETKTETRVCTVQYDQSKEKEQKAQTEAGLCKICYIDDVGVVFLPCGHIVACVKCAASLSTCPVCRKPFSATVRAFLS